jgi:hypothetical protein
MPQIEANHSPPFHAKIWDARWSTSMPSIHRCGVAIRFREISCLIIDTNMTGSWEGECRWTKGKAWLHCLAMATFFDEKSEIEVWYHQTGA